MFGYVTIHKDELKVKDYTKYNAFYCGVCRSLNKNYGFTGRMTLTYDMTFLAVLLSGLYEDSGEPVMRHCVAHHIKKHGEIVNPYTDYAAAMNVMLSFYKLKDNYEDEKSIKSNIAAGLLKKAYKKAKKRYPAQAQAIEEYIKTQHSYEKKGEQNIDKVSSCTGVMLGKIFCMYNDEFSNNLYETGLFLGKFIYVMDAFEDVTEDIKKHNYNPLIKEFDRPDFNEYCKGILMDYAGYFARAFERLPILVNIDILRNIIYAGIWSKYNRLIKDKGNKHE